MKIVGKKAHASFFRARRRGRMVDGHVVIAYGADDNTFCQHPVYSYRRRM